MLLDEAGTKSCLHLHTCSGGKSDSSMLYPAPWANQGSSAASSQRTSCEQEGKEKQTVTISRKHSTAAADSHDTSRSRTDRRHAAGERARRDSRKARYRRAPHVLELLDEFLDYSQSQSLFNEHLRVSFRLMMKLVKALVRADQRGSNDSFFVKVKVAYAAREAVTMGHLEAIVTLHRSFQTSWPRSKWWKRHMLAPRVWILSRGCMRIPHCATSPRSSLERR